MGTILKFRPNKLICPGTTPGFDPAHPASEGCNFSGFVGWMLTEFLAKPFRKGVDLTSDVLIVFDNVQAR